LSGSPRISPFYPVGQDARDMYLAYPALTMKHRVAEKSIFRRILGYNTPTSTSVCLECACMCLTTPLYVCAGLQYACVQLEYAYIRLFMVKHTRGQILGPSRFHRKESRIMGVPLPLTASRARQYPPPSMPLCGGQV